MHAIHRSSMPPCLNRSEHAVQLTPTPPRLSPQAPFRRARVRCSATTQTAAGGSALGPAIPVHPDPVLSTAEIPFRFTQNAGTDVNSGYDSLFHFQARYDMYNGFPYSLSDHGNSHERSGQLSRSAQTHWGPASRNNLKGRPLFASQYLGCTRAEHGDPLLPTPVFEFEF